MKEFYNHKWYRPREIAQLGLIQSSSGKNSVAGNYHFILRLIKTGQLKAKDYSLVGGKPYYLVREDEIEKYHNQFSKPQGVGRGTRQSKARKPKV